MIRIESEILSRNGTTRARLSVIDEKKLLHDDVLTLESSHARDRFAKKAAAKTGHGVTEIEAMVLDILNRLPPQPAPELNTPTRKPSNAPAPEDIINSPEPLRIAEHFLTNKHTDASGNLTKRRYRGQWWKFNGSSYEAVENEQVRAQIYQHLDRLYVPIREKDGTETGEYQKICPRTADVREVENALMASGTLVTGDMPQWLKDGPWPAPVNAVPFRNGILDVERFRNGDTTLIPPTPLWFSSVYCPYDFDPAAKCPTWLRFLSEAHEGDDESSMALQEWFGVQLVPDNRHELYMMLVGKSRAGKGVTITGMEAMLGKDQVASTSFQKLTSRFGLHPLLGKLCAVLPDAHINDSTDAKAALEIIKNITGNDPVGIDRKGIDELPQIHLPIRFTIAVNELPRFPDEAGALKPRTLLLYYGKSFAGREDKTLKQRIAAEAPGIAVWALEGLCRLREQGGFTVPEKTKAIFAEFERTLSPIKCFLHERCEVRAGEWVEKDKLYDGWSAWCRERGDEPGNKPYFGQKLINADPRIQSARRGPEGQQFRVYEGVRLLT